MKRQLLFITAGIIIGHCTSAQVSITALTMEYDSSSGDVKRYHNGQPFTGYAEDNNSGVQHTRRKIDFKNGYVEGEVHSWTNYGNKAMTLKAMVRNKYLDGKFESWHDQGQPKAITYFEKGNQTGPLQVWYKNGRPLFSETVDVYGNYLLTGWYENGQIASKLSIKKGESTAHFVAWWENKKVKMMGQFNTVNVKESWTQLLFYKLYPNTVNHRGWIPDYLHYADDPVCDRRYTGYEKGVWTSYHENGKVWCKIEIADSVQLEQFVKDQVVPNNRHHDMVDRTWYPEGKSDVFFLSKAGLNPQFFHLDSNNLGQVSIKK